MVSFVVLIVPGPSAEYANVVDGLSPREGARRMVRWFDKPVNENPPTFAHHGDSKL